MRDGMLGVIGTGSTILLQEVSLWLSITCAAVTLLHFGVVFNDIRKERKRNAGIRKILREEEEDEKEG